MRYVSKLIWASISLYPKEWNDFYGISENLQVLLIIKC